MGLFETLKQRLRQHQNGKPYGEPVLGMHELKLRDFEPGGEGLLVPIQVGLLFFSKTDRHNIYTYKEEQVDTERGGSAPAQTFLSRRAMRAAFSPKSAVT